MNFKLKRYFFLFICFLFVQQLSAQQTLFIDKQEYSCANSFSIAVRTKNITNLVALQGSIQWDTNVVKFNTISYGASAIAIAAANMNLSSSSNGIISFLWFDNNVQPQSVVDSTILFTLNFLTNGSGKGTTSVAFTNLPTALEIDTLDGTGTPVANNGSIFSNGYIITPFVYNFTGSGNWSVASNWKNNLIPPASLPACSEIVVSPSGAAECVLDMPQTVATGAKFTVVAGKKLRILSNLVLN